MKHKLSISNNRCYGNKFVIAIIIILICVEKPLKVYSDGSLVVPEEALPTNNFMEKCEQMCFEQVGSIKKKK